MKGDIGAKERQGLTLQNAAKIDAETKIISTQREGEGKKQEIKVKSQVQIYENQRAADVAEANAELATKKAGWAQQAKLAEVEAEKAVAIREAELQREVERKNALAKTEQLKADQLSKATVDYDIKVQEANAMLYTKQKEAEAVLYEQEKAAEGLRVAAEAQLYTRKQAADAEFYAKMKEAEGLKVLAKAQGIYIITLLKSLGGNYNALSLMINGGMLKEIAQINAEAIKGLQPKISVWSNGGGTIEGSGNGNAAMKEIASVYRALQPLFQTVHDQTG